MPKSHESLNRINSNYLWIGEDDNLHVFIPFLGMQKNLLIANASDIHTCWEDFFGFSSNRRSIFSELDAYIKIAELIKNSCAPGDDISGFEKRLKQASAYRNFFEQIKSLSDSQRLETFKKLFAAHNTNIYSMLLSPQEPSGSSMATYIDHTFSLNDNGPDSLPSQLRTLYNDKKQSNVTSTLDAIAVQFFLGLVNIHCKSFKISDNNFGKALEASDELKKALISSLSRDFGDREGEKALLSFINQNREHFDLTRDFTEDEKNHLINEFHKKISYIRRDVEPTNYRELILFQNDQTNKNFFLHEGRMYCDAIRVAQEAGIPTDSNEFIRDIEPLTIVDPLNREKMIFKLPEYTATIDMTQLADSTGDPIALTDTLRQLKLSDQLTLMKTLGEKIYGNVGDFSSFFFLLRETVSYETAAALLFDEETFCRNLKNFIEDSESLIRILQILRSAEQAALIKRILENIDLAQEQILFIQNLCFNKTSTSLYALTSPILKLLDQDQRSAVIKNLDLDGKIENIIDLLYILQICKPDGQISAIENLASSISRIVTSSTRVEYILPDLNTESQGTFIGKLDLNKVFNNYLALASTLRIISLPDQQIHLIEKLGDKIGTVIGHDHGLTDVLKSLSAPAKMFLIKQLEFKNIDIHYSNLISILKLLDQDQQSALIEKLGDRISTLICDDNALVKVLKLLDQDQQSALIKKLGDMSNVINSVNQLCYVLKKLCASLHMLLINQLNFEKTSICYIGLPPILSLLNQDEQSVLIKKLRTMKNPLFQYNGELLYVLENSKPPVRMLLINQLDFNKIRIDDSELIPILKLLDQDQRSVLVEKLGDNLPKFARTYNQVIEVLTNLDRKGKMIFIEKLGNTHHTVIRTFDQVTQLLKNLDNKLNFDELILIINLLNNTLLTRVVIENLKDSLSAIIVSYDQMLKVLEKSNPEIYCIFIECLDFNKIIMNFDHLVDILKVLQKKEKIELIKKLEHKLHTVIKDSDQVTQLLKNLDNTLNFDELIFILKQLDQPLGRGVIQELGRNLSTIIINYDQVTNVLENLDPEGKMIFIEKLGLRYLWNLPSLPKPMPKFIGDIFRTLRPEQRISQAINLLSNPPPKYRFFKNNDKEESLITVLSGNYSSFLDLSKAINDQRPNIGPNQALKEKWNFITSMFEEASSPSDDQRHAEAAKLLASRPDTKALVEFDKIELKCFNPESNGNSSDDDEEAEEELPKEGVGAQEFPLRRLKANSNSDRNTENPTNQAFPASKF